MPSRKSLVVVASVWSCSSTASCASRSFWPETSSARFISAIDRGPCARRAARSAVTDASSAVGDHAVDDAELERACGVDGLAEHRELRGPCRSDEAGEEVRARQVGDQPDANKRLHEGCRLSRNPQVARERERKARAGGDAVHRRDHRLVHRSDDADCGGVVVPEDRADVKPSCVRGAEVLATAESAPCPGDDHGTHLRARGAFAQCGGHLIQQCRRDRVEHVGSVQRQRQHAVGERLQKLRSRSRRRLDSHRAGAVTSVISTVMRCRRRLDSHRAELYADPAPSSRRRS